MDILKPIPEQWRSHVPPSLVEYFARPQLTKTEQLAGHALSHFGTPVFQKGRSRSAVDCIGLVCLAVSDLGIAYKDNHDYSFDHNGLYKKLCTALPQAFKKSRAKTLRVGDVVALRHPKCRGHVLIVLPRGYFVHAEGENMIGQHSMGRVTIGTMGPNWIARLEAMGGKFSVWRLKV